MGFMLLEEVEAAMGTTEQKVKRVSLVDLEDPWLSALSARVPRQQAEVRKVKVDAFVCSNKDDVEKLLHLVQNCHWFEVTRMYIWGEIGAEGWETLARALSSMDAGALELHTSLRVMLGGQLEDFKAVWDALGRPNNGSGIFNLTEGDDSPLQFFWQTDEEKEEKWGELEQVLRPAFGLE